MPYLIYKSNVSLYSTGATYAAEPAYSYGGLKFIHGFNGVLTTVWYVEDLHSFMVLMGSDYPLVSGGLNFIHGFNRVLTTLWYLEDLKSFTVLMGY